MLAIRAIENLCIPPSEQRITKRDTILYALGLGFGDDPMHRGELSFVYENELRSIPTMANVLCHPGFWAQDAKYGIDWVRLLHAEQHLEIHRSLPVEGTVTGETIIQGIEDRGAEKGALLHQQKRLFDARDGSLLATVRQTLMLRGNGGQGGLGIPLAAAQPIPSRPPDRCVTIATRAGLALLYRLSGDWNPLHADPEVARAAGFDRPILHGLCSKGIAARALISEYCAFDASRLSGMFVRFSSPMLPGETLRFDFFEDGEKIWFRATAIERDVVVLDRCFATLRAVLPTKPSIDAQVQPGDALV